MAYPSGVTSTNLLLKLQLNRQAEADMKVLLMQNDKTALLAAYDELITNITADRAVANGVTNVNTLTQ